MTDLFVRQRKGLLILLVCLLGPACGPGNSKAPPPAPQPGGILDTSFGTGGIALMSTAATDVSGIDVAIQSDGKIVVVGHDSAGSKALVARYLPDGMLDPTFGSGGVVLTLVGGFSSYGRAVVIQSDGKIVVAGDCSLVAGQSFLLLRYNSDGSLDTTFNTTGIVTLSDPGGACSLLGLALQSDGMILAAGNYYSSGNAMAAARFKADGSLDTSFGTAGLALAVVDTGVDNFCNAIALQPDGKIILAGETSATNSNFIVVRLNSDGSLDTGFDGTGKAEIAMNPTYYDGAEKVAVDASGRIVLAGQARQSDGTLMDIAVARLSADGSLDLTFNGSGKVITHTATVQQSASALILMPDGRMVVGGYTTTGTRRDWVLVRYLSNGAQDPSFGAGGILSIPIDSGGFESCSGLALEADGKIVGVGYAKNATNYELVVLRIDP